MECDKIVMVNTALPTPLAGLTSALCSSNTCTRSWLFVAAAIIRGLAHWLSTKFTFALWLSKYCAHSVLPLFAADINGVSR